MYIKQKIYNNTIILPTVITFSYAMILVNILLKNDIQIYTQNCNYIEIIY